MFNYFTISDCSPSLGFAKKLKEERDCLLLNHHSDHIHEYTNKNNLSFFVLSSNRTQITTFLEIYIRTNIPKQIEIYITTYVYAAEDMYMTLNFIAGNDTKLFKKICRLHFEKKILFECSKYVT